MSTDASSAGSQTIDIRAEVIRRAKLARRLDGDVGAQRAMMAHYANDPLAWFDDWAWTYDPRIKAPNPRRLPFILWPKQRELLLWRRERTAADENGLVKKGRDLGASWLFCGDSVHEWIFAKETAITFGSRKEPLVDKLGDPKSLFWKIRMLLEMLPAWMLPEGFDRRHHDNFLRLINPANGSVITGEGGDEMGRGGRSTIYFADEFAFMPRADRVDAAINDNASSVIYLSTSNGLGTRFHQKEIEGQIPIFYFHWSDRPGRDEAWKAKKIAETDEATFAREHDLDDANAHDMVLIPAAWVAAAVGLDLDPEGPERFALDVADTGRDESILTRRQGPTAHELIDLDGDAPTAGRAALECVHVSGAGVLVYDRGGVGAAVAGEAQRYRHIEAIAVLPGGRASQVVYDDDPERTAHQRFSNWGTEAWWALRLRFRKTYEAVNGLADHDWDELISIPADAVLIRQLSSRRYETRGDGRLMAESKKSMAKRGVPSPDRADSLAYAFAPDPNPKPAPPRFIGVI